MPSIAASTIAAPGPLVSSYESSSQETAVGGSSSSLVPLRSRLSSSEVLDTVTAGSLVGRGVPVQSTWKNVPPSSSSWSRYIAKTTAAIPVAGATVVGEIPQQVYDVSASDSVSKVSGAIQSLVSVSFLTLTGDPNYSYAQVWITGYSGVSTPQLMASGSTSPIAFIAQPTGETVTLTVVAVGPSGDSASFAAAPTATVVLNGVDTAPPAPTINQAVVALAAGAGWQFAWNVLNGLLADIIAGYWVYTSATNSVSTATRYQYYAQPPSNIGVMTAQQLTSSTLYYWVSSVDTTGLESTLTPANTETVVSSYYPTVAAEGSGNPTDSTFSSLPLAYDQNETTCASGYVDSNASISVSAIWSGFPTFPGTATAITLKVMNSTDYIYYDNQGDNDDYPGDSPYQPSVIASLLYSLDGGVSWTSFDGISNESSGQQYMAATLPTTQNLTLVEVQAVNASTAPTANTDDPDSQLPQMPLCEMTFNIYEIRVEVTESLIG